MPRDSTAADVVAALLTRGLTVATGESITAGLVSGVLASVPGCSAVLRGGIVAYQTGVKTALLDVPEDVVARGVVSEAVARAMAVGSARVLGADVGIGTTGAAGPEPHDGEPAGSVWIAVATASQSRAEHLSLSGSRAEIRNAVVQACLSLTMRTLGEADPEA